MNAVDRANLLLCAIQIAKELGWIGCGTAGPTSRAGSFPNRCPHCGSSDGYLPTLDGFKCVSCRTLVVADGALAREAFDSAMARYRQALAELEGRPEEGLLWKAGRRVARVAFSAGLFILLFGVALVASCWWGGWTFLYALVVYVLIEAVIRSTSKWRKKRQLTLHRTRNALAIQAIQSKIDTLERAYYG